MDNHADNLMTDNYFAGLIDSDFGVYIHKHYPKGKVQLRPIIDFVNTRFGLVDACHDFLLNKNINHHVGLEKATKGKDHKRIKILRLTKCAEFSSNWYRFCVARRKQLELMEEFCYSRIHYVQNKGWKYNNTPYTDRQHTIYGEIYKLNADPNFDLGFRNNTFSWLAGMIDGDGSVYFSITTRDCEYVKKSGNIKTYTYTKVQPWIKVTTASDAALNNICELYDKYKLRYYVDKSKGRINRKIDKKGKKYYYSVRVKEFDHLLFLCDKLEDKLLFKSQQLSLMKEYILIKKKDRRNTDYLLDIANKVSSLNNYF